MHLTPRPSHKPPKSWEVRCIAEMGNFKWLQWICTVLKNRNNSSDYWDYSSVGADQCRSLVLFLIFSNPADLRSYLRSKRHASMQYEVQSLYIFHAPLSKSFLSKVRSKLNVYLTVGGSFP